MPTPMQIGNANSPRKATKEIAPLVWEKLTTPETTKTEAPLSSHFSCSRCSPLDRR